MDENKKREEEVLANSAVEDVGGIVFSLKFTTYSRSISDETATICSARDAPYPQD